MGYAFISYSTKNKESAEAIKRLLNENGVDTWMAPNDIPPGSKYAKIIGGAIKGCSCFVLLLTNNSQESFWVAKEVERAINYQKVIIPLQLEDVVLNDEFEMYISTDQILPVKKIDDTAVEIHELLKSVKQYTSSANTATEEKEIYNCSEQLQIGDVVCHRYKIIKEIRSNGCVGLFIVEDERLNIHREIKVVYKNTKYYEDYGRSWIDKSFILMKNNFLAIPEILDMIDETEYWVLVMESVDGRSLSEFIKANGTQLEKDVLMFGVQLTEAIKNLHILGQDFVYNNLNPATIFVKPNMNLTLLDPGAIDVFEGDADPVSIKGTSFYKAPETRTPQKIDQRTDIFSIGAILYSLITGSDPSIPPHVIYPIRSRNPELSVGMENIVLKCMEANPKDRYQSAGELLEDLKNIDKINHRLNNPSIFRKIKAKFKHN